MDSTEERLEELPTEGRNPRSAHIDELPTLEMLRVINDEDATIAGAVRAALPEIAEAVDAVGARFARGGRLFYIGAGTSGRLGVLDASECPPTFSAESRQFVGLIAGGDAALRNSSEHSEDSPEEGAQNLAEQGLTANDALIGIAASGRTPYVLGGLSYASKIGALTIALTCAGGPAAPSRMAESAELAIELATGAEVLTGSTRMKAGTATKLVLNMISTGVMIRRGAVYGNLMVDVRPTNAKLVDRAQRIIQAAAGCDAETAAELLREGGSAKVAIVMQQRKLARRDAERLLAGYAGRLADALRASAGVS